MSKYDPWNEILPGLWQGGCWVPPRRDYGFHAVLTTGRNSELVEDGIKHKEFYFEDTNEMPAQYELDDAVAWVWQRVMHGEPVLVRCHAGLNRSGLIVASTLVMLGATPDEAITLIRAKRSRDALFNPLFEQYVRNLA